MRMIVCTLALCIGSLLACKGQPHATSSSAPPAPPATPVAVEPETSPAAPPSSDDRALPQQGQPCPEGVCADGLRCLSYYGIAGANGPKFASCELPCGADPKACPADQQCVVIADGPGQVCKPL